MRKLLIILGIVAAVGAGATAQQSNVTNAVVIAALQAMGLFGDGYVVGTVPIWSTAANQFQPGAPTPAFPLLAPVTPADCSAPQYSFTGDTDTGIGYGGANIVGIGAGGAPCRVTISSAALTSSVPVFLGNRQMLSRFSWGGDDNNVWVGAVNTTVTGVNPVDGNANSAVGVNALAANTIGSGNSALGLNALTANTTGNGNSAVGRSALRGNTTGTFNSAIGLSALAANTIGSGNSAVGLDALTANTTGGDNSAVGVNALAGNTIGTFNSAVGVSALRGNTTGTFNSAIGVSALRGNTTGTFNSAVGTRAGYGVGGVNANTTGTSNLFLGYETVGAAETDTNSIVIGASAIGLGSNTVVLGNTSIVTTQLRGVVTAPSLAFASLAVSATAPSAPVACTSPTIAWSNGTVAFEVDVGTTCAGVTTLAITLPAVTNGWQCYVSNVTTAARNVEATAWTTTSVTFTNFARTTGLATDWVDGANVRVACMGG